MKKGEHACAAVTCVPPLIEDCQEGGCGFIQGDGCCMECCNGPCADCFENPCNNYVCDDNPNYTCQATYCGGCNRQWLRESGDLVHCFSERRVNILFYFALKYCVDNQGGSFNRFHQMEIIALM